MEPSLHKLRVPPGSFRDATTDGCIYSLPLFWKLLAEWSQKTFGTDQERGPIGPLKHLIKEANEAIAKPDDLEEFADLLFLCFDATRRPGFSYDELVEACFVKLTKNRTRAWNKPTSNEPVEHVR